MINLFNNKFKKSKGQVAVVLIIIVAVALIFYAVSLNLGRVAQTKTVVTIASNTSASQLGSQMASYGQSIFQTQLGGKPKVCAWTGIFVAILGIIIAIVALILTIFTGNGWQLVLAFLAVVAAAANLAIQATIIQPGLTDMWNKITSQTLSIQDQFVEQGVRNGLQVAVTDNKLVPDFNDSDADRVWGFDGIKPKDQVSRFGVYYTARLAGVVFGSSVDVDDFQDGLKEFLYDNPANLSIGLKDNWGLYDPIPKPPDVHPCNSDPKPSECNPCCVPLTVPDPSGAGPDIEIRPKCCDSGGIDQCGVSTTCASESPYGSQYSFVYDKFYENYENTFLSFREQLGRDDESQNFIKLEINPNGLQTAAIGSGFKLEDTTGFYTLPVYSPPTDTRSGIFQMFYKNRDWGLNLAALDTTLHLEQCYWYDIQYEPLISPCKGVFLPKELTNPTALTLDDVGLDLPNDPTDITKISYNTTNFVDSTNPLSLPPSYLLGDPPLAVDLLLLTDNIWAKDDICAQSMLGNPLTDGFWKAGGDRYCDNGDVPPPSTWPYYVGCPKNLSISCDEDGDTIADDCSCESVPPANRIDFPDDVLDDIIYGIPEFLEWAEGFLATPKAELVSSFTDWYLEAAEWIEPGTDPAPTGSSAVSGTDCVVCNAKDGGLVYWLKEIKEMKLRLTNWKTNTNLGYAGTQCSDVWCIPPGDDPTNPGNACPMVNPSEEAVFDANGNGVRGDMEDIVSCLDYNVEGYDPVLGEVNPVGTNEGNDYRFKKCGDTCSLEHCYELPRSLIPHARPPAYNTQGYQPVNPITAAGDWKDIQAFRKCLDECSLENCTVDPGPPLPATLPAVHTSDGLTAYTYPLAPINPVTDCDPLVWGPGLGNLWYDAVEANLISITPPDETDIALMLACYDSCSNATCQSMPLTQTTSGLPYTYVDPTIFDETLDCTLLPSGQSVPTAIWQTNIKSSLIQAGGPSCNLDTDEWLDLTRRSVPEAQNQVAKFRQRRNFLVNRLSELNNLFSVLDKGEIAFDAFLNGPAKDLIQARINYAYNPADAGLPYHTIYGWKSDPAPGKTDGYWHIVKVEVRTPGRCDNACAEDQSSADPPWPRVRTYTKNWGTKRCYEMADTTGSVKVRVTRFDEDRKPNILTFPNGEKLWSFKFFHPSRGKMNPFNLEATCGPIMIPDPSGLPAGVNDIYKNAFIMDKIIKNGNPGANEACWNRVHDLLVGGVMSETCAQYYFHEGSKPGFDFKFVPCKAF